MRCSEAMGEIFRSKDCASCSEAMGEVFRSKRCMFGSRVKEAQFASRRLPCVLCGACGVVCVVFLYVALCCVFFVGCL